MPYDISGELAMVLASLEAGNSSLKVLEAARGSESVTCFPHSNQRLLTGKQGPVADSRYLLLITGHTHGCTRVTACLVPL